MMTRPPHRAPARVRHIAAPAALESLEARMVLSTVFWDGGGGDRLGSNPLNWNGDVVPVEADDVVPIEAQTYIGTFEDVHAYPNSWQVQYQYSYLPNGAFELVWS